MDSIVRLFTGEGSSTGQHSAAMQNPSTAPEGSLNAQSPSGASPQPRVTHEDTTNANHELTTITSSPTHMQELPSQRWPSPPAVAGRKHTINTVKLKNTKSSRTEAMEFAPSMAADEPIVLRPLQRLAAQDAQKAGQHQNQQLTQESLREHSTSARLPKRAKPLRRRQTGSAASFAVNRQTPAINHVTAVNQPVAFQSLEYLDAAEVSSGIPIDDQTAQQPNQEHIGADNRILHQENNAPIHNVNPWPTIAPQTYPSQAQTYAAAANPSQASLQAQIPQQGFAPQQFNFGPSIPPAYYVPQQTANLYGYAPSANTVQPPFYQANRQAYPPPPQPPQPPPPVQHQQPPQPSLSAQRRHPPQPVQRHISLQWIPPPVPPPPNVTRSSNPHHAIGQPPGGTVAEEPMYNASGPWNNGPNAGGTGWQSAGLTAAVPQHGISMHATSGQPNDSNAHFQGATPSTSAPLLTDLSEDEEMKPAEVADRGKNRADGLPPGGHFVHGSMPLQLLLMDKMQAFTDRLDEQADVNKLMLNNVKQCMRTVQVVQNDLTELRQEAAAAATGPIRRDRRRRLPPAPAPVTPHMPRNSAEKPTNPEGSDAAAEIHASGKDVTHNNFMANIRDYLRFLLKFKTWKQLAARYPPLTDAEIDAIDADAPDAIHCTLKDFRIDFVHPWKNFPLNEEASFLFCRNFLAAVKAGRFEKPMPRHLLTHVHVKQAMDNHMTYCCEMYRFHTRNSKKKAATIKVKTNKRKAKNSRKRSLYRSRIEVIIRRSNRLKHLLRVFKKTKPRHMSGDESEGGKKKHPPIFRQIDAEWMSRELRNALHRLDQIYREDWENPGGGVRAISGNPPRVRLPSTGKSENIRAPKGLGKNCYDPTWLKKLKPHQRTALEISSEIWDLSIPDDIDVQSEDENMDENADDYGDGDDEGDDDEGDDNEGDDNDNDNDDNEDDSVEDEENTTKNGDGQSRERQSGEGQKKETEEEEEEEEEL